MLLTLPAFAQADRTWILDQSTLTYHMSHPLHEVDGVSRAAKGKGVCHAGQCDFLLAVPVKSFNSGDTNRDLHMLQVTRGAQFPIVSVRLRLPDSSLASPTLDCDLEVQFAKLLGHPALECREEGLGAQEQPPVLDEAGRHAAVHRLAEERVLLADLLSKAKKSRSQSSSTQLAFAPNSTRE